MLFVEIRVVDDHGADVEPGEFGEVIYRSPQLCEGYWEKPEETAEAFRNGWFHSGDLARIDDEGYITIVDKIKDVINTGGSWSPPARSRTRSTHTRQWQRRRSSGHQTSAGSKR